MPLITCPKCRNSYDVPQNMINRSIRCGICGNVYPALSSYTSPSKPQKHPNNPSAVSKGISTQQQKQKKSKSNDRWILWVGGGVIIFVFILLTIINENISVFWLMSVLSALLLIGLIIIFIKWIAKSRYEEEKSWWTIIGTILLNLAVAAFFAIKYWVLKH